MQTGGAPEEPPGWRTLSLSLFSREARSLDWAPSSAAPFEDGSWGAGGGRGTSPARKASLPREQEAEPRPADLLLEVRGLGRPSRPHFLQPRPTPCSPRVYGNSGLDGFSEIILSLCPHLTLPAPRGTQAGRPGSCKKGWEPFLGARGPGPPNIFLLNLPFTDQNPGSADSWEIGAIVGCI